jgi:hypothetical protein
MAFGDPLTKRSPCRDAAPNGSVQLTRTQGNRAAHVRVVTELRCSALTGAQLTSWTLDSYVNCVHADEPDPFRSRKRCDSYWPRGLRLRSPAPAIQMDYAPESDVGGVSH